MNEKKLIFAGVTRVSTEDQEKFGGGLWEVGRSCHIDILPSAANRLNRNEDRIVALGLTRREEGDTFLTY